jgi:hypothetical protein
MRKSFFIKNLTRKRIGALFFFGILSLILLGSNVGLVFSQTLVINGKENDGTGLYEKMYTFHTNNGTTEIPHKLYVSIPGSLYNYYKNKNHDLFNISEYSNFLTPNIFKSFAENIQKVTDNDSNSDEAFVNAVLEIVQQIQYNSSGAKFPIETLLDYSGDCDPLSLLTASILKAGGLDVVLFYYETSPISHVNVGVHLAEEPIYLYGKNVFYFEYKDKKYFTVETIADYWRVGDQPEGLVGIEPTIISLENFDNTSFLQISANLDSPLLPSLISLDLVPDFLQVKKGETFINVSGSISPEYPNQLVFVNIVYDSFFSYDIIKRVTTDKFGGYSFVWSFNSSGLYSFQTSWNGFQRYAGSVSEKLSFYVGLAQLLESHEVPETLEIGSQIIPSVGLTFSGNRIIEQQYSRKIFEKNFTETNILFQAEFFILRSNSSISSEQKITIPSYEYTVFSRRNSYTRMMPERIFLIPSYKQYMNNHLEFTISKNCSSAKILSDYDVSQVIDNPDSLFFKTPQFSKENIWYKIVAEIIENRIVVKLFDEENVVYFSETLPIEQDPPVEFKIIMKYEPDSIIVLRSLQAENLDQENQSNEEIIEEFTYPQFVNDINVTVARIESLEPEISIESATVRFPLIQIVVVIAAVSFVVSVGFYLFFIKRKNV